MAAKKIHVVKFDVGSGDDRLDTVTEGCETTSLQYREIKTS